MQAALEEAGIAEDTIVIFTSDNGPASAGGHEPGYFGSAGGLRGSKRQLYEGGIRVPAIIAWPGTIPAGTESEVPAYLPDLMPTLLAAAGATAPEGSGVSLLPVLRGETATLPERPLYWAYWGPSYSVGDPGMAAGEDEAAGVEALRQGDLKALRFSNRPPELYDLAADPAEARNLADSDPATLARLLAAMDEEAAAEWH